MSSIQGFIDEVITVIRDQVSVALVVPDDPVDNPPDWPFAPVYLVEGKCFVSPPGSVTYYHQVTVGLLALAQDIGVAVRVLLPQLEVVVEAIFDQLTDPTKGFTNTQNFNEITYVMGPVEWGGQDMFGFLFTISDVKIQRTY